MLRGEWFSCSYLFSTLSFLDSDDAGWWVTMYYVMYTCGCRDCAMNRGFRVTGLNANTVH